MKKYFPMILAILLFANAEAQENHTKLLIGTYTNSCKSDGIYVYDFNTETADFELKSFTKNVINPSYLTLSEDNKFVYCVNEDGEKSTVSAFRFNAETGKLELANIQKSEGADPCYIINDAKNVIAANYSGGSIAVFGKNANGGLAKAKQVVKHHGKSINPDRQESPHVHQVQFSPDKKFVLANDLGTDRIYVYHYNPDPEKEVLVFKDSVPIQSGSGPRHLTFSRDGKFVYLLQELDGALTVFTFNNGKMRRLQETTVVTPGFKGENGAADIHISEDGKFLYATNRGEANTISVFSIDAKGKLTLVTTMPTGGKGPRNFAIVPGGKFVLVAHEKSNEVIVFKRDSVTGELAHMGKKMELCAPVCLVFTN